MIPYGLDYVTAIAGPVRRRLMTRFRIQNFILRGAVGGLLIQIDGAVASRAKRDVAAIRRPHWKQAALGKAPVVLGIESESGGAAARQVVQPDIEDLLFKIEVVHRHSAASRGNGGPCQEARLSNGPEHPSFAVAPGQLQ